MSEHDYNLINQTGANLRADLNSVLSAIVSQNSKATEPTTMFAYMFWMDTTTGTLKQRNSTNTAWEAISSTSATAAAHVVRADQNINGRTSVTATIATGKLTLGLQPCIIQFRNSDVTNGAPNTKFVSTALSLATTDNGASFGLTTAVQGRLYIIAIDNGTATPVLGVNNSSGGIDLSETGVLTSTTAIAGAVISATTVYTTTALGAGLYPYKVVGAVDITWTSGSGYVTTPALVTGAGGNALSSMSSFGYGQTRQTGLTRAINGTVYTNSTSKVIEVTIYVSNSTTTGFSLSVTRGTVTTINYQPNTLAAGNVTMTVNFFVLIGETYSVTGSAATLQSWTEIC
jgi:hypothetical protein